MGSIHWGVDPNSRFGVVRDAVDLGSNLKKALGGRKPASSGQRSATTTAEMIALADR
jgi:hypothetical protein